MGTHTHTHTLALALRSSEFNLLSLCLTHSHPSITDTEGQTIDTVCKHHCLAAPTHTASQTLKCFRREWGQGEIKGGRQGKGEK